jgi:polar amino acid transport system substrate-binding protein
MLSHQPRVSRRSFLIQSSMVIGGVVAGPTLLSACTKTSTGTTSKLDQVKSAGKITVGIAGEQPYAFLDHGKLTGEDPTVQMAIWKAAGINTVEAKQVSFDALIPGLNAGDFDVVAAGMFINPTRCEQASFSEPVYCAQRLPGTAGQPGQHHRLRVGGESRDQAGCLQRRSRG